MQNVTFVTGTSFAPIIYVNAKCKCLSSLYMLQVMFVCRRLDLVEPNALSFSIYSQKGITFFTPAGGRKEIYIWRATCMDVICNLDGHNEAPT